MEQLDLEDIIDQMLKEAELEKKAEKDLPKQPVKQSAWVFKGVYLVTQKQVCTLCKSETQISQGFFKHYQHKKEDKTWETKMEPSSLEAPNPILGEKELTQIKVHGCFNCYHEMLAEQSAEEM